MNSSVRKFSLLSSIFIATALLSVQSLAAGYPEHPIELIVPWGRGGGADQMARLIGTLVEPILGQGVVVVNIPGGTGTTGMAKLLAAPADGYSMAVYIADSHALLAGKNPHWSMNDITPIAVMMKAPSFLFVRQDSPFKAWADLAKYAKARPGALKVATLGFGSVDSFSLNTLERSGIDFLQMPLAKPSERYVSVLDGRADVLYEQAGDVAQLLENKKIRPLLLFGERRQAAFKDVPTSYEVGYKIALSQFRSIVIRSGTSAEIVKKLSDALAKVYVSPKFQQFIKSQFADANSFESAATATAFVQRQLDDMKWTIKRN